MDLPPGVPTPVRAELRVPRRSGRYELCVDLVQQVHGEVRRLPVPAVRQPVAVHGDHAESELARLIDSHFLRPAPPPACDTGT